MWLKRRLALLLLAFIFPFAPGLCAEGEQQPNVLFIAVDDLRPQLGCYGRTYMHSPNIDALADRGVLFERAYCMVSVCGASRASLMTSIRPSRTRFTSYLTWAERDAPDALPLHTHFLRHGYTTISLGKVFHHAADHVDGWSERPWRSNLHGYRDQDRERAAIEEDKRRWPNKSRHRGYPFESYDADDSEYPDGQCAAKAIEYLERFAAAPERPFFLAVGFLKPHLPFCAPKKYWDLYDRTDIELPPNYWPPRGAPNVAIHNSGELRAYAGIHPSAPVDRETAITLIHGYYACVSFVDAQIGRVVDALDRLGLADNTIIVLWGDHGWQLGEHGMWAKHSCFETSMHAPLIIVPPRSSGISAGSRIPQLVEFIDVYPTLCELAGLPIPGHVEGKSLVDLMRAPAQAVSMPAVGRYGSGDTIRTDDYRYAEYRDKRGNVIGRMLFDHRYDPDENENIADQNPGVVERLSEQLNAMKGK